MIIMNGMVQRKSNTSYRNEIVLLLVKIKAFHKLLEQP